MNKLYFGLVKVNKGIHKGRIGYYDDETDDGKKCIVYFNDPYFNDIEYEINKNYIQNATTNDILERSEVLSYKIKTSNALKNTKAFKLLSEYYYIEDKFKERLLKAKLYPNTNSKKIFISYSSTNKKFVNWINIDLRNAGHNTWLDEWEIKVGDSIPKKIAEGIEECDYVLVVLSKRSVESNWVENEWQAKYWDEIEEGKVKVLPVLLEKCKIPTLLKNRKYANFTREYTKGFREIVESLNRI